MNHWIVKSEPETYSWTQFVKDGGTAWTSVRNFQARNNLRAMRRGDFVYFYHSGEGKEIVGLAKVAKEAYADPTAKEGDWACVDLQPVKALAMPVTLVTIKADKLLNGMLMVKNSRLSVTPLNKEQFERVMALAAK